MKMNATEIVGWVSSVILVLTIGKQVYKQWHEGSSEGVSSWLFVGQMAASLGFTIYSWLVGNKVFVVTNSLMLLNALVGFGIVRRHRKRRQQQEGVSKQQGARKLEAEQA
ncbi:MAG TPA: hypothetical protein VGC89_15750 [Pyrinomonadaceae bacterium]